MDIEREKKDIIERIKSTNDAHLILEIKQVLENDRLLKESIERGLQQSREGNVFTHEEVMEEVRLRFGLNGD
ncbi:MAG: hypothetical protein R8G66_14770 [Cytophagales bacterium]|nr:hypothetical protein [Cytophagales bacterium]